MVPQKEDVKKIRKINRRKNRERKNREIIKKKRRKSQKEKWQKKPDKKSEKDEQKFEDKRKKLHKAGKVHKRRNEKREETIKKSWTYCFQLMILLCALKPIFKRIDVSVFVKWLSNFILICWNLIDLCAVAYLRASKFHQPKCLNGIWVNLLKSFVFGEWKKTFSFISDNLDIMELWLSAGRHKIHLLELCEFNLIAFFWKMSL